MGDEFNGMETPAQKAAREIAAYRLAVEQEFAKDEVSGEMCADDTPQDIQRKVRKLMIECMPAMAKRVRHLIDYAESENTQLKACKLAYDIVTAQAAGGPVDAMEEMFRKLTEGATPTEAVKDQTRNSKI